MHEKSPEQPWTVLAEKFFSVDSRKFSAQIRRLDFDNDAHVLLFRCETNEADLATLVEVYSHLWNSARKGFVEMLCTRAGYGQDGPLGFSFWQENDDIGEPGLVSLYYLEKEAFVEEVFFVRFVLQSLQTFAEVAEETLADRQLALDFRTDASRVKKAMLKGWLDLWAKGKDEQLPPRWRAQHDDVLE